ncbi:MAG: pentapeptide repeat-containing protein [Cyanobium sp.]
MTDRPHMAPFLGLSARLTGFPIVDLEGTGMAELYHDVVREGLGQDGFEALLAAGPPGPGGADQIPTASQRLIRLWYTGLWEDTQVDPQAYREGLLWRAIETNPPGSRPPGYGTWALEPSLRATLARGLASLLLMLALVLGWGHPAQAASAADLLRLKQANTCSSCDLSAADLSHKDLYGAAISASDLTGADLSGSLLNDARLVRSTLVNAKLKDALLIGADLSGSQLNGADLSESHLTNAILRGAELRGAEFAGADLSSADLRQAQLAGAKLAGANLAGSRLQNADLSNTDLSHADLRHADLRQAVLDGARLCGADLQEALMPDGRRADGLTPAC